MVATPFRSTEPRNAARAHARPSMLAALCALWLFATSARAQHPVLDAMPNPVLATSLALGVDDVVAASERQSRENIARAIDAADAATGAQTRANIEAALRRGDREAALREAESLAQRAPGSWVAAQQECAHLLALDRRDAAVLKCQRAVQLEERVETYLSLAIALYARQTREDVREATLVLQTASRRYSAPHATVLRCAVALIVTSRTDENHSELVDCAEHLRARAPNTAASEVFSCWAALARGRWDEARAHVAAADRLGAARDAIEPLRREVARHKPWWRSVFEALGPLFLLWLALFTTTFAWARSHSRAWLDALREPGSTRAVIAPPTGARSAYTALVLHLASTWRISLVMGALALSTAVFGAALWVLSRLDRFPLQLLLAPGIVLLMFAWFTFVAVTQGMRLPHQGEPLPLREHPALLALIERCAARCGAKPIAEVYLTSSTHFEVYASAPLRALAFGEPELYLRLGAGIIDALDAHEFETLLTAELARAQRKENAGGAATLQIIETLVTPPSGATDVSMYVQYFCKAFRRASLALARAQELVADRITVELVGPARFEAALRAFVTCQETFASRCSAVVQRCAEKDEPLTDVYTAARDATIDHEAATRDIDAEWNRTCSELASQAAPAQRVERVRAYGFDDPPSSDEPAEAAWELFVAPGRVRERLTDIVCDAYARQTGIVLRDGKQSATEAPAPGEAP